MARLPMSLACREMTKATVAHLAEIGWHPDDIVGHLSLRYMARLSLLKTLQEERSAKVSLNEETQVIMWCYVACQTHVATETLFWLCLAPAMQLEVCKWLTMKRATKTKGNSCRRGGYIVEPEIPASAYIVIHGSARVGESPHVQEGEERNARDAVDAAMLDEPVLRTSSHASPETAYEEDVRTPSHVFGSLRVPCQVKKTAIEARNEARSLYKFMRHEVDRAKSLGYIVGESSCGREADETYSEKEGEIVTSLAEELLPKPQSSLNETIVVDWTLEASPGQKAMSSEIFHSADGFHRNGLLSKTEIMACLTNKKFYDFKQYVLQWFHLFDKNSDGEIELRELETAVANFDKMYRNPRVPAPDESDLAVDLTIEPRHYEFGEDEWNATATSAENQGETSEDDQALPTDWTWGCSKKGSPSFSIDTEYLRLDVADKELDEFWERALTSTRPRGLPGLLSVSDVLALRSRGLGFLCAYASSTELACGTSLCEEGDVPEVIFLVMEGQVAFSRICTPCGDDDASILAAREAGICFDTVDLGSIPGPVLINDMPHVLSQGKSPMRAVTATACRAICVKASHFRRLLRTHDAERQALFDSAMLRAAWLNERLLARDQMVAHLSGVDPTLPPAPEYSRVGRYWKLWSAGAVLADPRDRVKWLERLKRPFESVPTAFFGAPPAFFGGSVLTKAEVEFAKRAALTNPRSRQERSMDELRRARASIAVSTTGCLGSFVQPSGFDKRTKVATAPIDLPTEVVYPTPEALRIARSVPLLQPFPTATRARNLHGCRLPVGLEKARANTSRPQDRRSMAALAVSRERCNTAPTKLRDASEEIARYRPLLDGDSNGNVEDDEVSSEDLRELQSPLITRSHRKNFGFSTQRAKSRRPRILSLDHNSRLQSGLKPLAGARLSSRDRDAIHAAVGRMVENVPCSAIPPALTLDVRSFAAGSRQRCVSASVNKLDCSTVSEDARLRRMRTTKRAARSRIENYARMSTGCVLKREHSIDAAVGEGRALSEDPYFHAVPKQNPSRTRKPMDFAAADVRTKKMAMVTTGLSVSSS